MTDKNFLYLMFGSILILIILFFIGIEQSRERCKQLYGQDYNYVSGKRTPDLCVNSNGEVKYLR